MASNYIKYLPINATNSEFKALAPHSKACRLSKGQKRARKLSCDGSCDAFSTRPSAPPVLAGPALQPFNCHTGHSNTYTNIIQKYKPFVSLQN